MLRSKNLLKDAEATLEYLDSVLTGTRFRRELLRQALTEMDWRREPDRLRILPNRRYTYDGLKRGVAMDANFSYYEYIITGLMRLQVGHDKKVVEAGILLLVSKRSEKSPYGSSANMVREEIGLLYPTISLPVSVALFDLGQPFVADEAPVAHASGHEAAVGFTQEQGGAQCYAA